MIFTLSIFTTINYFGTENVKAWYITSEPYMKNCYISNKFLGYQTKLIIGKTSGGNVTTSGHCNNNFSDLRFCSNNNTELNYWIENYTSGIQATVWINNTYNDSCIQMYYGWTTATTTSNGTLTFLLFDHFLGTGLNSTTWKTTGTPNPTFHNSEMYMSTNAVTRYISSYKTFSQNTSVQFRSHYKTPSTERGITVGYGINNFSPYTSPPNFIFNSGGSTVNYFIWANGATYSSSTTTSVTSVYKIHRLYREGASRIIGTINGTILSGADSTTNTPRTAMNISIGKGAGSEQSNITIDWIFVSTIRTSHQVFSSFGAELTGGKSKITISNVLPTTNTTYNVNYLIYHYMNISFTLVNNRSFSMITKIWMNSHYLTTIYAGNSSQSFELETYWKSYNFTYNTIYNLVINSSDVINYTNATYQFSYKRTGITSNSTSISFISNHINSTGTHQYKYNSLTGFLIYDNDTGNTTSITWDNNHENTTWSHTKTLLGNNSWFIHDNDTGNTTGIAWENNHQNTTWTHTKKLLVNNSWYIYDNDTGNTTAIAWENHHVNTTWSHNKNLLVNNSWLINDSDTANFTGNATCNLTGLSIYLPQFGMVVLMLITTFFLYMGYFLKDRKQGAWFLIFGSIFLLSLMMGFVAMFSGVWWFVSPVFVLFFVIVMRDGIFSLIYGKAYRRNA
jgi:hypothetical protein